MQITVTIQESELIFSLNVPAHSTLEDFKKMCEAESGFPVSSEFLIALNGVILQENEKSVQDLGLRDGEMVVMKRITRDLVQTPTSVLDDDPATIREMFLSSPDQLLLLKQNNPQLAEALFSGSLEKFEILLRQQIEEREKLQEQFIKMANSNPFETEAQRLIAEEIRNKNIQANMEAAMEHTPETFGSVTMLFVSCKVNGFPVKAFVDSGAQTTLMNIVTAERCNIMHLIDKRWTGLAQGVGVQKIIGRIHMVQIQIENTFLSSSLTVLESDDVDMLLGLDMLKRHQCCIDLKENHLTFSSTGTITKFLSESELPQYARLTKNTEDQKMEDVEVMAGTSNEFVNQEIILPTDNFTEIDVAEIVQLGFKRDLAIQELRKFDGDKSFAVDSLFSTFY